LSRILKANRISVDSDNKINIEVPDFRAENKNNLKPFREAKHEIAFENFDELAAAGEADFQKSSVENGDYEEVIKNASDEADKIIDNARTEAENIINNALREAEIDKNDIFENARSEGYNAGIDDAERETAGLKAQAHQALEEAIAEKERMIDSVESQMVDIIIKVSEKLIQKTLNIDDGVILNLVRQGLSQTTINGEVRIRVAECDYDNVVENKNELVDFTDGSASLEIVKDFSLGAGDCVIETPFGNIDCSLSRQFEGLKKDLYYILENR